MSGKRWLNQRGPMYPDDSSGDAVDLAYEMRNVFAGLGDQLELMAHPGIPRIAREILTEAAKQFDKQASDWEHVAQLAASSDRFPEYTASPPKSSGLVRSEKQCKKDGKE